MGAPASFTRLSQARLWRDLVDYYQAQGPTAFASGEVPWRITTSTFLAQAYADVVVAFARDARAAGLADGARPVTVVELGTGSGRLGFLVLKALGRQWSAAGLAELPVRLVLSDAATSNIDALEQHPQLRPFVEGGVLDFCVVDATRPEGATLRRGGRLALPGPTVLLSNYVFDSLPQDCFSFEAGNLFEQHAAVHGTPEALALQFEQRPLETPAYPSPERARFLTQYAGALGEGAFGFPVGALEALDRWGVLSQGPLLALVADKGPATADELRAAPPTPAVARHGSLSFLLNFHALVAYAEAQGGHAALAARAGVELRVMAWAGPNTPWHETRAAFAESVQQFEPLELHHLLNGCGAAHEHLNADALLSLWALTRFDPDFVTRFGEPLRRVATALDAAQTQRLLAAAEHTWNNSFEVGNSADGAFELATVLQKAGALGAAAQLYERSLDRRGAHPTTWFNLALCYANAGRHDEARRAAEALLRLAPEHPHGAALLQRLREP